MCSSTSSLPYINARLIQRTCRAATADLKLCVLSLDQLFSEQPASQPLIDPLTLSLIDRHTLILLNKTDSVSPTPAQLEALRSALASEGKRWYGCESEQPFWLVSVREGTGLQELAQGLQEQVKTRCVRCCGLERADAGSSAHLRSAGSSCRMIWSRHRS